MRLILAIGFVVLAALPAKARDLFIDNLAGYTIEARILDAPNCDGPAFTDTTLELFEKALCIFHRAARSPEDTDKVIGMMSQAQTRGLPPVHQELSSLISGLASCSGAQRHLDAYRASGNKNLLEEAFFCRDRRQSQADFQSILWNHALFEYAGGLGANRTLDARLSEMSACHGGVLAPTLDAECGLITNLTETEINAFVDNAVGDVIRTYFSGVESPITAMFQRKEKRAEGLLQSAQRGIVDLKAQAAAVNGEYSALNQVYIGARDQKMTPIYENYRQAILGASSILDEFDRWKGGLFLTSENINLLPKINERANDIQNELKRTQELAFLDKARALITQIRRLVNGAEENRATVVSFCRIYFCELTQLRAMPGLIRACRRPQLAGNPLCVGQDGQISDGTLKIDFNGPKTVLVSDLCRGAGVDPAFTIVNMSPTTSASCLAELP